MNITLLPQDQHFQDLLADITVITPESHSKQIYLYEERATGKVLRVYSRKLPNCCYNFRQSLEKLKHKNLEQLKQACKEEWRAIVETALSLSVSDYYVVLLFIKKMADFIHIEIKEQHAILFHCIYDIANGGRVGHMIAIGDLYKHKDANQLNPNLIQQHLKDLVEFGCIRIELEHIVLQEEIIFEHVSH